MDASCLLYGRPRQGAPRAEVLEVVDYIHTHSQAGSGEAPPAPRGAARRRRPHAGPCRGNPRSRLHAPPTRCPPLALAPQALCGTAAT